MDNSLVPVNKHWVPAHEDITRYGRSLGIKPEEDKDLMWLAQQALTAPLPAPWTTCRNTRTGHIVFYNNSTNTCTSRHPLEKPFCDTVQQIKASKKVTDASAKVAAALAAQVTSAVSPGVKPIASSVENDMSTVAELGRELVEMRQQQKEMKSAMDRQAAQHRMAMMVTNDEWRRNYTTLCQKLKATQAKANQISPPSTDMDPRMSRTTNQQRGNRQPPPERANNSALSALPIGGEAKPLQNDSSMTDGIRSERLSSADLSVPMLEMSSDVSSRRPAPPADGTENISSLNLLRRARAQLARVRECEQTAVQAVKQAEANETVLVSALQQAQRAQRQQIALLRRSRANQHELRSQVIALTQELMGRQHQVVGRVNDLDESLREAANALRRSPESLAVALASQPPLDAALAHTARLQRLALSSIDDVLSARRSLRARGRAEDFNRRVPRQHRVGAFDTAQSQSLSSARMDEMHEVTQWHHARAPTELDRALEQALETEAMLTSVLSHDHSADAGPDHHSDEDSMQREPSRQYLSVANGHNSYSLE